MEPWRLVWRKGVAPLLSDAALSALEAALATDDERLIQTVTTLPQPLAINESLPVEGACLIGFCGWQADGLQTVSEVESYFARMTFEVDQRIGEPAGSRWFLNWFDQSPRGVMRRELLPEVQRELAARESKEAV